MARQLIRETDDQGNPWTVENLLAALDAHVRDAPGHGTNCVCMDGYIRQFRRLLGIETQGEPEGGWDVFNQTLWFASPWHDRQRRLRYILSIVAKTDII